MSDTNLKYSEPPGYVKPPEHARQITEYLGFDPLIRLADMIDDIPDSDYRSKIDIYKSLLERTHPRKTDRASEEGAPIAINIGLVRDKIVGATDLVTIDAVVDDVDGDRHDAEDVA